jgi:hypothetical protein
VTLSHVQNTPREGANLELAVVVGARVTLARRLIDVALGDEDAHGLGIVDSLCHLQGQDLRNSRGREGVRGGAIEGL